MLIPVFEYRVTVQPSDIDEMNHANNVCYVRWMQEAAIAHSTHNGWSTARYFESGFAWVARRHTVEYLQPALVGDELIVQTWVADFKRVTSRRKYRFLRKLDLAVVAVAETHWAFLSIENRRPVKIPPEVADCFLPVGEEPTLEAK
ncbi:MAG: acyl-CoA thioesterase [Planctomycetaceae bacterium]|nr:acyl-CoA thioesterase [Planctomycetaceae bacterium]